MRKCVEAIMKSVATLADLAGLGAPKVSVHLQAQVPTRQEAVAIAVETLEAFAPHLLASPAVTLEGKIDQEMEVQH